MKSPTIDYEPLRMNTIGVEGGEGLELDNADDRSANSRSAVIGAAHGGDGAPPATKPDHDAGRGCWESITQYLRKTYDDNWGKQNTINRCFFLLEWVVKIAILVSLYQASADAKHRIDHLHSELASLRGQLEGAKEQLDAAVRAATNATIQAETASQAAVVAMHSAQSASDAASNATATAKNATIMAYQATTTAGSATTTASQARVIANTTKQLIGFTLRQIKEQNATLQSSKRTLTTLTGWINHTAGSISHAQKELTTVQKQVKTYSASVNASLSRYSTKLQQLENLEKDWKKRTFKAQSPTSFTLPQHLGATTTQSFTYKLQSSRGSVGHIVVSLTGFQAGCSGTYQRFWLFYYKRYRGWAYSAGLDKDGSDWATSYCHVTSAVPGYNDGSIPGTAYTGQGGYSATLSPPPHYPSCNSITFKLTLTQSGAAGYYLASAKLSVKEVPLVYDMNLGDGCYE